MRDESATTGNLAGGACDEANYASDAPLLSSPVTALLQQILISHPLLSVQRQNNLLRFTIDFSDLCSRQSPINSEKLEASDAQWSVTPNFAAGLPCPDRGEELLSVLLINEDAAGAQPAMRRLPQTDVIWETTAAHKQLLFALAEIGLDNIDMPVEDMVTARLALNAYRAQQQTQFTQSAEVTFDRSPAVAYLITCRRMIPLRCALMTDKTGTLACNGASKLWLLHQRGGRMRSNNMLWGALPMKPCSQGNVIAAKFYVRYFLGVSLSLSIVRTGCAISFAHLRRCRHCHAATETRSSVKLAFSLTSSTRCMLRY